MQCPVCKTVALVMTERSGIEIDYCPACRGVWLDRGELDKIMERSAPAPAYEAQEPPRHHRDWGRDARPEGHEHRTQGYPRRKKREGFLSDLFDFD